MSDTIPLRPCPWAGPEHQHELLAVSERINDVHIARIHCVRCGARGPSEYSKTEAGALLDACNAWNGRA